MGSLHHMWLSNYRIVQNILEGSKTAINPRKEEADFGNGNVCQRLLNTEWRGIIQEPSYLAHEAIELGEK